MSVVLYHNPKCSTSRNALALLREQGVEPTVVEYLKTGWDRETLERFGAWRALAQAHLGQSEPGADQQHDPYQGEPDSRADRQALVLQRATMLVFLAAAARARLVAPRVVAHGASVTVPLA